jgi:hypothetical protein
MELRCREQCGAPKPYATMQCIYQCVCQLPRTDHELIAIEVDASMTMYPRAPGEGMSSCGFAGWRGSKFGDDAAFPSVSSRAAPRIGGS